MSDEEEKDQLIIKVKIEVKNCEKNQEKYATHFETAAEFLNESLAILLKSNKILDDFVDKNRLISKDAYVLKIKKTEEIFEIRRIYNECVLPLRELLNEYGNVTRILRELVVNLRDTGESILTIEQNLNQMTIEELKNVSFPDFLWITNNFHLGHFDLKPQAEQLVNIITKKIDVYEEQRKKETGGNCHTRARGKKRLRLDD